jgi:predicted transcriptional regulator
MYRIDQLEDAIVAAIVAAGYGAKPFSREPAADEISGEITEEPATLVIFDRTEPAKTGFASLKGIDFYFNLVVTLRNLGGQSAAERGDGPFAGIYEILDGLRAALQENSLGLNVQPMVWLSEKPLRRTQRQSAYSQEWKLTVYE